jgi:Ca2+-dependent lipid-binding protein
MLLRRGVQTIKGNQNPKWNEEFQFLVHDVATDKLTLQVYDWDRTSANQKVCWGARVHSKRR